MTEYGVTPFPFSTLQNNLQFKALGEYSADIHTLLAQDGTVLYQSPSAHRPSGISPTCIPETGDNHLTSIHPEDRAQFVAQVLSSMPGITQTLTPYRLRHANGTWRWDEGTSVNLLNDPLVGGVLTQTRDVTFQMHAAQRARALAGLSLALASTTTTDEVVQVILLQGLEAMDAHRGGVVLLDADGQHVNLLGSVGHPEHVEKPWRRFPIDAPFPAADALRQGRDLFMTSEDWPTLYPHLTQARAPGTASTAVLTLRINGQVTGGITLSFEEDRPFSEADRQHLRSVAAQCALALERGELNVRLQQQQPRLLRQRNLRPVWGDHAGRHRHPGARRRQRVGQDHPAPQGSVHLRERREIRGRAQ